MGDRAQCHIEIGGTLPAGLLDTLSQLIADYDLRCDWDGEPFDATSLPVDAVLDLYDDQLNGGLVPELERFCAENGLAFRRWSGGCLGAFNPEIVAHYGPGDSHDATADDNENPAFTADEIERAASLDELKGVVANLRRELPPFRLAS